MTWARPAYMGLAWIFMLCVALQFFFGGLYVLGNESIDLHEMMGYPILHTLPIVMFLVALIGKLGKKIILWTVALFVLIFIQPIWALPDIEPQWLRAIHIPFALLIAGFGHHIAHTVTQEYKASKAN